MLRDVGKSVPGASLARAALGAAGTLEPAGDLKPLKEKECLEVNSQKSLKEGQSLTAWGTENAKVLGTFGSPACLM